MEEIMSIINNLLVDTFNEILAIEEKVLKNGVFNSVTVKEVHTIEAIGLYDSKTMSEVSNLLNITTGTLTVCINNLVNKGYVTRERQKIDKRVVKVSLTKKGKLMCRAHKQFHINLTKQLVSSLDNDEKTSLAKALSKLYLYLNKKNFSKELRNDIF